MILNRFIKLALALLPMVIASAQAGAPTRSNVPVITRLVQSFLAQEESLIEALRARDRARLDNLLAADFEQRDGTQPGTPVPRAEWLDASLQEATQYEVQVSQMAVHDLGADAVVSFVWQNSAIVDVWRRRGENWELAIRYASRTSPGVTAPGTRFPGVRIDKRY